jgi:hypothetical protein
VPVAVEEPVPGAVEEKERGAMEKKGPVTRSRGSNQHRFQTALSVAISREASFGGNTLAALLLDSHWFGLPFHAIATEYFHLSNWHL